MNIPPFFCLFFLLCFEVALGKIAFSCERYKVKPTEERAACLAKHLKKLFHITQQQSQDYKCCERYVKTICDNKIDKFCNDIKRESELNGGPYCKPANNYECTKYDPNDFSDENPKKNGKKPNAKKPEESNKKTSENLEGSKVKNSFSSLQSVLRLIICIIVVISFL